MRQITAARAQRLGLRIISRQSSATSARSKVPRGRNLREPSLPFLLPLNTPVLQRLVDQLRTMDVEQVALVETVAIAIARGQL